MCNLSQGIVNKANEDTVRRMLRIGKYSDEEIAVASDVALDRVKEIREEETENNLVTA